MLLQRLRERIKRWWQGELEQLPSGYPILRIVPQYRRHWTSRAAHAVLAFYLKEWRWLLPFLVAVVGALVAIKRL
ncbi:MAG: hypothetical protein WC681_13580 [Sterolibacterium sp.]